MNSCMKIEEISHVSQMYEIKMFLSKLFDPNVRIAHGIDRSDLRIFVSQKL